MYFELTLDKIGITSLFTEKPQNMHLDSGHHM